jgi:hypothetical protein
MRKKLYLSFFVVFVLLALLTSCGCKHEWKAATCTEPQTCTKCGNTQGEALGHKYGEEKTQKEATCTEAGVKEFVCTVCGEKKTTEITAKGHKWKLSQVLKEATCSEEGKGRYTCYVCGEAKYEEIEKLPHKYKNGYCIVCYAEDPSGVIFNPTEEEKEKIDRIDTIGDREIREDDDFYYLLFAFYDDDNNTVVAPCVLEIRIENDEGETVYRAKRIVETSDYSSWSNSYKRWILASPKIMRSDIKEGLSSTGTVYFTVKLVDSYFKEYSLNLSDLPVHSFDKEEVLREATCGTDGYVRKTCSSCGQVVEEKVPATGRHTYRKGTVVKEPTCTTEGIMEYACIVCGYVGSTEKIETVEHTFIDDRCTNCGTLRIGSKGPAGGLVFYDCDLDNEDGNEDGLTSSECGWRFLEAAPQDVGEAVFGYYRRSSNGENLYVNGDTNYYEENCTRTGIGYGKSNTEMLVDAMGDEAYIDSYGSEKTGNYAAKMCADYSLNGYDDWFLPSIDELGLMDLNLDKNGFGDFESGFCLYYWSSSENGRGYAWLQYISHGSPSSNYRYRSCYVRPIRAFSEDELCNHVWGDGVETIPACTNNGVMTYTCEICKQTKEESIPASMHTYVNYQCTGCGIWGKGPAGGYVFYDCDADNDSGNADGLISTECGWRYLEASPSDLSGRYSWGETGSFGTEIDLGKGKSNTYKLVEFASENSSFSFPAAKACYDYTYGGYSDWFLPSKDELNLMYENLKKDGLGVFTNEYYWSSSELYSYYAWYQYFSDGGQGDYKRSSYRFVRPIRAFNL